MTFLMCLHLDCDVSHEARYGIFHQWHHVRTQKVSDFGGFWILYFHIKNAQPVCDRKNWFSDIRKGLSDECVGTNKNRTEKQYALGKKEQKVPKLWDMKCVYLGTQDCFPESNWRNASTSLCLLYIYMHNTHIKKEYTPYC